VPLSASSSSSPYEISLLDIHDNVIQTAVVYGGSTNLGALEMSFKIYLTRISATHYSLNVTLYGATSLMRMQFFLLLIGSEAAGFIEAPTIC
jgi:hypothetical protein